ncbi:MAG TPA: hypothetical protein PLK77_08875 [Pyrinomonadaceae bacterium]|nr:hypothetical protein [Pyrinomonadaceae bacterium]
MAKEIRTKKSFGTLDVESVSPDYGDDYPISINMKITFEEALKLHLSLGQALAKLNSYDRSTVGGKNSAVNLCFHTRTRRLTVNEVQLPRNR